jgi:hypothetical protein
VLLLLPFFYTHSLTHSLPHSHPTGHSERCDRHAEEEEEEQQQYAAYSCCEGEEEEGEEGCLSAGVSLLAGLLCCLYSEAEGDQEMHLHR